MKYTEALGRLFFSLIFISSGIAHFSQNMIGYAASAGVPAPGVLVPLSGLIALLGGISVLLGFKTRVGALMLLIFLIPVTLTMHAFWRETDPMTAQMQQIQFLKNLALIGGAFVIHYFGAGVISLDAKLTRHEPVVDNNLDRPISAKAV